MPLVLQYFKLGPFREFSIGALWGMKALREITVTTRQLSLKDLQL